MHCKRWLHFQAVPPYHVIDEVTHQVWWNWSRLQCLKLPRSVALFSCWCKCCCRPCNYFLRGYIWLWCRRLVWLYTMAVELIRCLPGWCEYCCRGGFGLYKGRVIRNKFFTIWPKSLTNALTNVSNWGDGCRMSSSNLLPWSPNTTCCSYTTCPVPSSSPLWSEYRISWLRCPLGTTSTDTAGYVIPHVTRVVENLLRILLTKTVLILK